MDRPLRRQSSSTGMTLPSLAVNCYIVQATLNPKLKSTTEVGHAVSHTKPHGVASGGVQEVKLVQSSLLLNQAYINPLEGVNYGLF